MILSDKEILELCQESDAEERLVISSNTGVDVIQIQSASVDFRLGNTFSTPTDLPSGILTLNKEIEYQTVETDTYASAVAIRTCCDRRMDRTSE